MDKSILDLKLGYVTHACRRVIYAFKYLNIYAFKNAFNWLFKYCANNRPWNRILIQSASSCLSQPADISDNMFTACILICIWSIHNSFPFQNREYIDSAASPAKQKYGVGVIMHDDIKIFVDRYCERRRREHARGLAAGNLKNLRPSSFSSNLLVE
jgi:hypothetical protein